MKNYVKQLLRTPIQSVFIIVLIMLVTITLVVGGNLWITSDKISKAYENDFITIGTVTQKPDAVAEEERWDARDKDFRFYKRSRYNRYATAGDLNFPEVSYLVEPERRVYWGSYTPEYLHMVKAKGCDIRGTSGTVVEFSPKEDCVPEESVKIQITKVLGNNKAMEGSVVWFCDHYNRYPEELKADKTYVAMMSEAEFVHGKRCEEESVDDWRLEFAPDLVAPTLYTPEGKEIEDTLEMKGIYEVTDGFYETEEGQRLLTAADMEEFFYQTQPVVGTNSTDLIMPFYEESAWVYEGRYPTEEEYAQGSAVCLAPRFFAENNGLSVGDQVTTRLCYTDTRRGADQVFCMDGTMSRGFFFYGQDGEMLSPFEEKAYTIVGLYDYTPSVEGIGADELIVPFNSVQNKMENIVDYGAMADDNTAFRIENGSIAEFLEISAKHGVDNLVYTFYDRGYSALMEGVQNLRNMSAALLVMGLIAAVILTLQISHIYITKQKKRLSIERLLGMTGKRCGHISLAGVLILLLLGTVPGVAVGMSLTDGIGIEDRSQEKKEDAGQETAEQTMVEETAVEEPGTEQEAFSRKYSNLGLAVETEMDLSGQAQGDLAVSCMMGGLVLVLGMSISGITVHSLLKGEPLYLLESREKG